MPGGWVDPGETPAEAAIRETCEETGLVVSDPRPAGTIRRTDSVHHTFACRVIGGMLRVSHESLQVAFVDPATVHDWHIDHRERVAAGMAAQLP